MYMCVYVFECVCVCVYVCMSFYPKGILLSRMMLEIYTRKKVNDFTLKISMQCLCQLFSSSFPDLSNSKDETRSAQNQKENDIIYNLAQILMKENIFDIGYKSAHLPKRIHDEKVLKIWRLL